MAENIKGVVLVESEKHFVSAIIPVYNGQAFIADAISSIIRQNYDPMEIIVVDDGSTDHTASIVRSFPFVNYLFQENKGAPAARNRGLQAAKGDLIGFLDADDLWSDDKINLQLSLFNKEPSTEIVVGYTQRMQLIKTTEGNNFFRNYADPVLGMDFIAALIRRSVFDKVGSIDENFLHCDDWDWFMRAKELGVAMRVHREVVRYYRRHDHNITNEMTSENYYAVRMLKRSLDRRRKEKNGTARVLPNLSDFEIGKS